MSAEPLIVPVGQLLDVYNAERRWPELVPAAVRLGGQRRQLSQAEYQVWWLAHGVVELLGHGPWTASRMISLATGFGFGDIGPTIEALLARGLLTEVDTDHDAKIQFAASHRLIPLGEGLGNDPDLDVRQFNVGRREVPVLTLHPLVWLAWFWGPTEADAWATCLSLSTLGDPGQETSDPDTTVELLVGALHPMLAQGVTAVDLRWTGGTVPEAGPPRADPSREEVAVYPVGHGGGPVYTVDGELRSHHVRLGRQVHEISALEYFCWRAAHAQPTAPSDPLFTRRTLLELVRAMAERTGDRTLRTAEPALETLFTRGLLVPVDPADGHAFTASHRPQSLHTGLGFQIDDYYQIGLVSHGVTSPMETRSLSGGFDPFFIGLWQWGPLFPSLADAEHALAERDAGDGNLFTALSRLIGGNQSAYLDAALGVTL